jgi:hypothetical protein
MTTDQSSARYPHSSQLIQKAFRMIAAPTGQAKGELHAKYARTAGVSPDTVRAWQGGTARPHRPAEIAQLARDAVHIARLGQEWLRPFLRAVDAPSDLRRQLLNELCPPSSSSPNEPRAYDLLFRNGHAARAIDFDEYIPEATDEGDAAIVPDLPGLFGLPSGRPVLVLVGGATGLKQEAAQRLKPLFEDVLAPLCERLQLAVLDGGTDCGVMRLLAEARARANVTFPLIGVVPGECVCLPGEDRADGRAPLEPTHTHFIFIPGRDWRLQAWWLSACATAFAGGAPSLTVLANGGEISAYDVVHSQYAGRPVLAIEGSGRLADQLASALRTHSDDPRAQALAELKLGWSVDISDRAGFAATVEHILGHEPRRVYQNRQAADLQTFSPRRIERG